MLASLLPKSYIREYKEMNMEVIINGKQYIPAPEKPTVEGLKDALEVRFNSDAGDNITVRDYLRKLLERLWIEKEEFSGKRPFGNSGWDHELFAPLIKSGHIGGMLDQYGYIEDVNYNQANEFVKQLILEVFNG